jgi:glycosyltransferase involved in cell wall biosynthesis
MTTLMKGIAAFRSGNRVTPRPPDPTRIPRVSVVIPCYNYWHYLSACLGSAFDQPGVEIEAIVVDDASPDGSGAVAEQLAAADPRVRLIRHSRNKGHIATYNDGLEAARGDYLVLLSADDLLAPGSLTRAAALLEAYPEVGFTYGRAVEFSGDPPTGDDGSVRSWTIWPGHDWLQMRWRSARGCIWSPEVVMRTSVQRRIGGYRADMPHSGDTEMWMRAAAVSDVGHVNGPDQAYYRVHAANMHIVDFDGAGARGALVDLQQRRLMFEEVAAHAPSQADIDAAQRALAVEALMVATRSVSRSQPDADVIRELAEFAADVYPDAPQLRQWARVQRLLVIGPTRAKRHPAFVAREVGERAKDAARHWRLSHRGV